MVENIRWIKDGYFETDAISYSFLKAFAQSPAHTRIKYKSDAMDFGTALHDIILENKQYQVYTKLDGRTTEGIKQKKELEGVEYIIEDKDYNIIQELKKELYTRKVYDLTIQEIIENGIIEQGYICDFAGVKLRIKPDCYYAKTDKITIIDLKTIGSVNDFYWNVKRFKYDWQAYIYSSVLEAYTGLQSRFIFAVLEKTAPFGVKLFEVQSDFAGDHVLETIENYKNWKLWGGDTNIKYENEIETIII